MSKAILKMVSLLVELTKYVLCCKTLLLARIKAFFQIPIPVYTMTCTVYTFPQTLATVYRGCAREKVKLFKRRQYLPEPLVIYVHYCTMQYLSMLLPLVKKLNTQKLLYCISLGSGACVVHRLSTIVNPDYHLPPQYQYG